MIILVSGENRRPNLSGQEDKVSLAEMKAAIAGEAVWWHISCMTKSEKNIFVCHEECENEYRICTVVVIQTVSVIKIVFCFLFDTSVDFIGCRIYAVCRTSIASTRRSALIYSNAR